MSFLSNLFSKNTREATALTTLNIAREYAAKKYNIPVDFIDDLILANEALDSASN